MIQNKTGPKKKSRSASKSAKSNRNQIQNNNQPKKEQHQFNDVASQVLLSKSVTDYARSLANPFTGPASGVVTYPSCISLKQRSWSRGTFDTGSAGCGYVVCDPAKLLFNNRNGVGFSSTFTILPSSIVADPSSIASGNLVNQSNSQFSDLSVGNAADNLQYRIVSCGIRIRYTGTELNRGGTIYALMDPTHDSMSGRTIGQMNQEVTMVRFSVEREWVTVLWRPVRDSEFQYSGTVPVGNYFPMGFIITSPTGSSVSYEYEAYANGEFQGTTVRGMTPTPHDSPGFAAVNYTMQTSKTLNPTTASSPKREGDVIGNIASYLANGTSHVKSTTHANVAKAREVSNSNSGNSFMGAAMEALAKSAIPITVSVLGALA